VGKGVASADRPNSDCVETVSECGVETSAETGKMSRRRSSQRINNPVSNQHTVIIISMILSCYFILRVAFDQAMRRIVPQTILLSYQIDCGIGGIITLHTITSIADLQPRLIYLNSSS
jgi:hypothetical protein